MLKKIKYKIENVSRQLESITRTKWKIFNFKSKNNQKLTITKLLTDYKLFQRELWNWKTKAS